VAARHAREALALAPASAEVQQFVARVRQATSSDRAADRQSGAGTVSGKLRFVVIKSWGYGLWSDVDHVLGQLLLARITGRIPVIHWGSNSLFRNPDADEAFTTLFEPVSDVSLADVAGKGRSYFPSKWSDTNIDRNDVNKWDGAFSRMTGLYFVNREEDVVVSDFHTYLADLVPWIAPGHPLHGMSAQDTYRQLFAEYIRPRPDILESIEGFWQREMKDRHLLAVHVRGSDKTIEITKLNEVNATYDARIRAYLDRHPEAQIFLLTDSVTVLHEYRHAWGPRLISTDCARSDTQQGVHHQSRADRRRIGAEVIRDVFLAARCRHFIGNGSSNVSTSVLHVRKWDPSEVELVYDNLLFKPNFLMHNR
jgi:hypothetical protein